MTYEVVFHDYSGYECVDAETESIDQAHELVSELTMSMSFAGERNFCYYIRKKGQGRKSPFYFIKKEEL